MKQKMLRFALFCCLTLVFMAGMAFSGAANAAAQGLPENHWAEPYANALVNRGILAKDAAEFSAPDSYAGTRDVLSMIFKAWGGEYGDVLDSAYELGILDVEMAVGETLTRNNMAKVTIQSLELLFGEGDEGDNYLAALQLEDYDACHSCRGFVSQSYVRGLLIGRRASFFDGEELLTNAEAWTVVSRMLDYNLRLVPEPEEADPVLITADAASRIINSPQTVVVLDVRNPDELSAGFIPGSICIPLAELKETNASAISHAKQDVVIVYCQGGGRSAQARELLEELGFTTVYDLGGIGNWTFELEYPAN